MTGSVRLVDSFNDKEIRTSSVAPMRYAAGAPLPQRSCTEAAMGVEKRRGDAPPKSCGQCSKAPPRILSVGWASVAIGARARPMVRVTASLIGGIGTSVKDNYRGV